MTYENILYEADGRVAYITLNRPEKLNALSNELRGELFHALKEAEADRAVGAIIIRGAGRAFLGRRVIIPRMLTRGLFYLIQILLILLTTIGADMY